MKYEQLTQDGMDDEVATALGGREREHHNYSLNLAVYEAILADPNTTDPTWRQQVEELVASTKREMNKVESIHGGLSAQLSDPIRRSKAIARVAAKTSQG